MTTTLKTRPQSEDDPLPVDDDRIISNTYDNPARLPTGTFKISAALARADALEEEARTLRAAVAIMTGVQTAVKAASFDRTLAAAKRLRTPSQPSSNGHTTPQWGVPEFAGRDVQQQRIEVIRTRLHIGPATLQELNDGLATRGIAIQNSSSLGPILVKHLGAVAQREANSRRFVWRLPRATHTTPTRHAAPPKPPRRKRQHRPPVTGAGASPEKLSAIVEILAAADRPMTAKELSAALRERGIAGGLTGMVAYLRRGELRKIGKGKGRLRYLLPKHPDVS